MWETIVIIFIVLRVGYPTLILFVFFLFLLWLKSVWLNRLLFEKGGVVVFLIGVFLIPLFWDDVLWQNVSWYDGLYKKDIPTWLHVIQGLANVVGLFVLMVISSFFVPTDEEDSEEDSAIPNEEIPQKPDSPSHTPASAAPFGSDSAATNLPKGDNEKSAKSEAMVNLHQYLQDSHWEKRRYPWRNGILVRRDGGEARRLF